MAKNSKIIPVAHFCKFSFFSEWLVQVIKFSLFFTSSLVLLVIFKRKELEMPDWTHLKDLFKIFPFVTNFLWIRWKTTKLEAVKHEQDYGDSKRFSKLLFLGFFFHNFTCFVHNSWTDKARNAWLVLFQRSFQDLSNRHQFQ